MRLFAAQKCIVFVLTTSHERGTQAPVLATLGPGADEMRLGQPPQRV